MKVAVPVWQGRVSPVLDVASTVLVADVRDGEVRRSVGRQLTGEERKSKAARLAELGVDVLICGAVSRTLAESLTGAGVEVIPHICGEAEAVLTAYAESKLTSEFSMPGCPRGERPKHKSSRGAPRPGPASKHGPHAEDLRFCDSRQSQTK